jgi:hypothetical protein
VPPSLLLPSQPFQTQAESPSLPISNDVNGADSEHISSQTIPHALNLKPFGTWRGSDIPPFLGGALLGLVIHESGHFSAAYALNADPSVHGVSGGGVSFFAVRYGRPLSPHDAYVVSTAGFLFQFASSEWVLAKHPDLWNEDAPIAKGVFAFHVVTSFVYAYGALLDTGPTARDTIGMASHLGISERWVGVAILVPALLDLYRSVHPEADWATYTSRSIKVGFVLTLTK